MAIADESVVGLGQQPDRGEMNFVQNGRSPPLVGVSVGLQDAPVAEALRGDVAAPALVVVKGGKRPRAARAELSGGAALLDSIAGGGASFAKFSGGLPAWPEAEPEEPAAAAEEGDEYDL